MPPKWPYCHERGIQVLPFYKRRMNEIKHIFRNSRDKSKIMRYKTDNLPYWSVSVWTLKPGYPGSSSKVKQPERIGSKAELQSFSSSSLAACCILLFSRAIPQLWQLGSAVVVHFLFHSLQLPSHVYLSHLYRTLSFVTVPRNHVKILLLC